LINKTHKNNKQKEHTEYQTAQLAGNSVHVDRAFLARHMPDLAAHLHYRIVDVSTLAELARCGGVLVPVLTAGFFGDEG
jgi:oligoribonuclease (3'-5' exoribonuclease)